MERSAWLSWCEALVLIGISIVITQRGHLPFFARLDNFGNLAVSLGEFGDEARSRIANQYIRTFHEFLPRCLLSSDLRTLVNANRQALLIGTTVPG